MFITTGLRMVVLTRTVRGERFGDIWHFYEHLECDEHVNSWRCLPGLFLRVARMVVVIIEGFRVCICF